jgi:hypothetical protein
MQNQYSLSGVVQCISIATSAKPSGQGDRPYLLAFGNREQYKLGGVVSGKLNKMANLQEL